MAIADLEKCTVTGPVLPPDGVPVTAGTITFTLSRRDRDGDITVLPAPVTVEIDADGNIEVELWPNAAGLAGTSYTARVDTVRNQRNAVVALQRKALEFEFGDQG